MITVVKPEQPYNPKCGDVCWGDKEIGKWLFEKTPERIDKRQRFRLDTYLENPWDGLALVGVAAHQLNRRYECPVTGLEFWMVVPFCLWIKDVKTYRVGALTASHYDYAFDIDFHEHMFAHRDGEVPNIHDKMLGTGYELGCRPNDGHGKVIELLAELENGDYLQVFTWEWYNK